MVQITASSKVCLVIFDRKIYSTSCFYKKMFTINVLKTLEVYTILNQLNLKNNQVELYNSATA